MSDKVSSGYSVFIVISERDFVFWTASYPQYRHFGLGSGLGASGSQHFSGGFGLLQTFTVA